MALALIAMHSHVSRLTGECPYCQRDPVLAHRARQEGTTDFGDPVSGAVHVALEMHEWLETNAPGRYRVLVQPYDQISTYGYVELTDENDAFAFKMRWAGTPSFVAFVEHILTRNELVEALTTLRPWKF